MCFFAIKQIKEVGELTFDYNWVCDKHKKRQNVSVGQKNDEGLLKNLKQKTKKGTKSKIPIGSVMIMTKK